jgi:A/G-specific adenine glycosylase
LTRPAFRSCSGSRSLGVVDGKRVATYRRAALSWHRRHARSFSWRSHTNPYAVLIGEVLLQRTRGEQVEAVYRRFIERWPTPAALAKARTPSIASVIRPLGLAKRAPKLAQLGRELDSLGVVPMSPEDLLELPGVGPYTAHAVPVFAGNASLPLVDWVIARILRRYFGLDSSERPNADRRLWELARTMAQKGRARELWLGSLDLAAAVCRPRPLCQTCPLRSSCAYFAANSAAR